LDEKEKERKDKDEKENSREEIEGLEDHLLLLLNRLLPCQNFFFMQNKDPYSEECLQQV
jgi:hypothetical protein